MKYRIDGLTLDGKRITVCHTRSPYEARSIRAANRSKFDRVLVYDENGEVGDADLDARADAVGSPDA